MPNSSCTPHAARRRFGAGRIAIVALGLGLVVAFVLHVGVSAIANQLSRAGVRVLWLLVPCAVGTSIAAFPWASFLPRDVRPSLGGLVRSRFVATIASSLLPMFGLAGEPARLLWLPAPARARGTAAIVVDRALYNSASGVLLIAGAYTAWRSTSLAPSLVLVAFVIGALILTITLGAFWLVARVGVGRHLESLLRRLFKRSNGSGDFGARVDRSLLDILRGPVRPLFAGLGVHFAARSALACEAYVGLWALRAHATLAQSLVVAVVPIALSLFFSSVPSQIGVQEGAQTLIATSLQLDPATVLSLVLLQRFRQLTFAAFLPFLLASAPSDAPETPTTRVPSR